MDIRPRIRSGFTLIELLIVVCIVGILAGLVIFVLAFPVLFWNEGRTVHRAKALAEGESVCEESPATPDVSLDGKLVHVSAEAVSDETLSDDLFPVSITGIRLERVVEMYQWQEDSKSETKKNLGGSTDTTVTYTYHKRWLDHAEDSSGFQEAGPDNPPMPIGGAEVQAGAVRLGGFELPEEIIRRIGGETPLAFDPGEAGFEPPFPAETAVAGGVVYLRPGLRRPTQDRRQNGETEPGSRRPTQDEKANTVTNDAPDAATNAAPAAVAPAWAALKEGLAAFARLQCGPEFERA